MSQALLRKWFSPARALLDRGCPIVRRSAPSRHGCLRRVVANRTRWGKGGLTLMSRESRIPPDRAHGSAGNPDRAVGLAFASFVARGRRAEVA